MTSFELSKRSPLTTTLSDGIHYTYTFSFVDNITPVKDENEEISESQIPIQISVNPSNTPIIPSLASDDIDDFKRNVAFTVKLSSSIMKVTKGQLYLQYLMIMELDTVHVFGICLRA